MRIRGHVIFRRVKDISRMGNLYKVHEDFEMFRCIIKQLNTINNNINRPQYKRNTIKQLYTLYIQGLTQRTTLRIL